MKNQAVNAPENLKNNPGYDVNPQFSADGKYIAWQSMARDGYESDRNRLCVYELATGKKNYVSDKFDSNVEGFVWNKDNKSLSFIGDGTGVTNTKALAYLTIDIQLTTCGTIQTGVTGDDVILPHRRQSPNWDCLLSVRPPSSRSSPYRHNR